MEKSRRTDVIITVATVVISLASVVQGYELIVGSRDTHNLALAAVAANRAWLAPVSIHLESPLESGFPVKYAIHIVNPGKEPAIGINWNVRPREVPYIPSFGNPDATVMDKMESNTACDGVEPRPSDGMVLYPTSETANWIPLEIPDTTENRRLINEVLSKTKTLVIDGCFAYTTGGGKHTSSFRFFLRDESDKPSFITDELGKSWRFNATLTGNEAN